MTRLRQPAFAVALALAAGCLSAGAPSLAFATAVAPPSAPTITKPGAGRLVRATTTVEGHVDASTTAIRVTVGSQVATDVAVTPAGTGADFTANVPVLYGRAVITVEAGNEAGFSLPATVVVWNLGAVPSKSRLVLIDKSDFTLYVMRAHRVIKRYPVAIGTPSTPTPVGSFNLGGPHPAGGDWGVLRMPLRKSVRVKVRVTRRVHGRRVVRTVWRTVRRGTRYYVHGTNAPWSIGTAASHGCVRMYNSNVRALSKVVRGWPVTIRR